MCGYSHSCDTLNRAVAFRPKLFKVVIMIAHYYLFAASSGCEPFCIDFLNAAGRVSVMPPLFIDV